MGPGAEHRRDASRAGPGLQRVVDRLGRIQGRKANVEDTRNVISIRGLGQRSQLGQPSLDAFPVGIGDDRIECAVAVEAVLDPGNRHQLRHLCTRALLFGRQAVERRRECDREPDHDEEACRSFRGHQLPKDACGTARP